MALFEVLNCMATPLPIRIPRHMVWKIGGGIVEGYRIPLVFALALTHDLKKPQ